MQQFNVGICSKGAGFTKQEVKLVLCYFHIHSYGQHAIRHTFVKLMARSSSFLCGSHFGLLLIK